MKLEGKNCSKPTIRKIMERHGLGSRCQRRLKLEAQHLKEGRQLSQEQIKSIEKANPCFKERHGESKAPGCLHMASSPAMQPSSCTTTCCPFQDHGLKIEAILTDNGREYCGILTPHHYEIYLELNGIEHRKTRIVTPKTNGFAERFTRTGKEELPDIALRRKPHSGVEGLQADLNE